MSDALDRHGLGGQVLGLAPLEPSYRLVGPAYTVRMCPGGSSGGTVGDYIDDVPAGAVVVVDNGGRVDVSVWGELLTTTAHLRGLAGTVIHGVCRDVPRSLELRYPIFSRGRFMRTGKGRVVATEYRAPVSLGEVRVEAGDLILGDADGVIVVPRERLAEVLATALEIGSTEEEIRLAVTNGMRLDEARRRFHYFELQGRGK